MHALRSIRTVESLEARCLLTGDVGVTVITHGFQFNESFPDWMITMGQAILDRADGPRTDRVTGSIFRHDQSSGQWQPADNGVWNNSNRRDEHVVLLFDWTIDSNDLQDGWLEAAADSLFASLVQTNDQLAGDLAGSRFLDVACEQINPCEEVDFHFIGHSRGAVLNALTTERFGNHFPQITIDQVTSLDPHPVSTIPDPGYLPTDPDNSRLATYSNVGFADNYYRQDFLYELDLDFNGVIADGAANLRIPESVLTGAGSSIEHSDIHTWYYGTITEPFAPDYSGYSGSGRNHDGDVSFPESWYGVPGVPARNAAGFAFSAIAGGDRELLPPEFQWLGQPSQPTQTATVFNGDLRYVGSSSTNIPGWQDHGGGGGAAISGSEAYLQLAGPGNGSRRQHNPLYFAENIVGLRYDFHVNAADGNGNDALVVRVGLTPVDSIGLSETTTGFIRNHRIYFSAAGNDGFVNRLEFRIDDGGSDGITAQVRIDNVVLIAAPAVPGDFDDDGDLDGIDIDTLTAAIAGGSTNPVFDLTDDQQVNQSDLHAWLAIAGAANLPSGNAYLLGDANLDGVVDGSDFGIWNSSKFTSVAAWTHGDFNADGVVDGSDFGIWNANKFQNAMRRRRDGRDGRDARMEGSEDLLASLPGFSINPIPERVKGIEPS